MRVSESMIGWHDGGIVGHRLDFRFDVMWKTKNLKEWLKTLGEKPLFCSLEGTVFMEGHTDSPVPVKGGLMEINYREGYISYEFMFEIDSPDDDCSYFTKTPSHFHYVGEKLDIGILNLPWSHTTCFGTITDDCCAFVANSVTYFRFRDAPAFLASVRP